MTEELKKQIRKRLNLKKYPRRNKAQFLDEDDHNPFILADCPDCYGSGRSCVSKTDGDTRTVSLTGCSACDSTGTTGEVVRYFADDLAEVIVKVDNDGWLSCPNCTRRYTIRDTNVWTGRRHKTCGQKIKIL
jgi:hypothetical protein